jgi:hypothetical protein
MVVSMTNDHLRQRLPNRRFRRLLPAAVAAVTLATSAPFVVPQPSHAEPKPHKAHAAQNPGKIPAVLRAGTTRGIRLQDSSST